MASALVKIWVNQILLGSQSFKNVPVNKKADVKALLQKYVENNTITQERFDELTNEK